MDAVDDRTGVRLFRYAAWAALVALFLVTVTGATVRLTGSGLGCENWPRCGEQVLPEAEAGYHAYVEFGNRVVGFAVGLTTLAAAAIAWRARVPARRSSASRSRCRSSCSRRACSAGSPSSWS